jgi:hypothetical protein
MRTTRLAIWTTLGLMMGLTGCTTYYKVSDPASGRAYYTTKVKRAGQTGAVKFEDEKTGSTVTLQSSEVKEISREEFDAAVEATGEAPAQK